MSAAAGGGALAVMDADAAHAEAYRIVFGVIDSTPQAMKAESDEARAAVAELIAADKEYDEARKGYDPRTATPEQIERLARAELRRRRALSNIEGGK